MLNPVTLSQSGIKVGSKPVKNLQSVDAAKSIIFGTKNHLAQNFAVILGLVRHCEDPDGQLVFRRHYRARHHCHCPAEKKRGEQHEGKVERDERKVINYMSSSCFASTCDRNVDTAVSKVGAHDPPRRIRSIPHQRTAAASYNSSSPFSRIYYTFRRSKISHTSFWNARSCPSTWQPAPLSPYFALNLALTGAQRETLYLTTQSWSLNFHSLIISYINNRPT